MGVPIGIEATALSLEIIQKIDPEWTEVLAKYVSDERIEFIGSGYSQLIGPLVPSSVNDWNQKIGIQGYEKILGMRPRIALVNEMAYSAGILEHYAKYEFEAFIMEWNNPRSAHPEWDNEFRYFPQMVTDQQKNVELPVIWSDSIAFQKFQRYVFGEHDIIEYMKYLDSHRGPQSRFFPLYSNDVEIFNFRPGRYHTETDSYGNLDWERIFDLYDTLQRSESSSLVFPLDVLIGLNNNQGGAVINLESVEQPIPVKKQAKYNVNRWALSGRDDLFINSNCYSIHNNLVETGNTNVSDWKELCYLWSSDFRTHITEARWKDYRNRLTTAEKLWSHKSERKSGQNKNHGINDTKVHQDLDIIVIDNSNIICRLNPKRGNSILDCAFKKMGEKPLFGTIKHGYYDSITLGADFYSGHAVVSPPVKHKISDLDIIVPGIKNSKHGPIIESTHRAENIEIETTILAISDGIRIRKKIIQPSRIAATIHPMHITLFPDAWELSTLYFATKNGGSEYEYFPLGVDHVLHRNLYSNLISSIHSLGATSGELIIGDAEKSLLITQDSGVGAVLPGITYIPLDANNFFFRVTYSALELDETFRTNQKPQSICTEITITPFSQKQLL